MHSSASTRLREKAGLGGGVKASRKRRAPTPSPISLLSPKKSRAGPCKPGPKYGRESECVCGRTMSPRPGSVCVCVCASASFPFDLDSSGERWSQPCTQPRPSKSTRFVIYGAMNSASKPLDGNRHPKMILLLYGSSLPPLPQRTKESSVHQTKRALSLSLWKAVSKLFQIKAHDAWICVPLKCLFCNSPSASFTSYLYCA